MSDASIKYMQESASGILENCNTIVNTDNGLYDTHRKSLTKEIEESLLVTESDFKRFKIKSLSKLHKSGSNSIIIPKENMNSFFYRLASVSRLNSLNRPMESLFQNGEKKNFKQKDTTLLDAGFNLNEILNDKNNLLLTEENLLKNSHDFLRDNEIINLPENNNLSFSIDENIEVNLVENNNFNLKSQPKITNNLNQYETFNKSPIKKVENKTPKGNSSISTPTSRVNKLKFSENEKKGMALRKKLPDKSVTSKTIKINTLNNQINNKLTVNRNRVINLDASTSNATIKSTLNSNFKNNKVKSPINIKQNQENIKTFTPARPGNAVYKKPIISKMSITPLASVQNKKRPISFISKFNLNQSTISSRDNNNKNNSMINKTQDKTRKSNSTLTSRSKKDILNTSSAFSKKANDSKKNLMKSFDCSNKTTSSIVVEKKKALLISEFNVIEEYDYSKILIELRAIFGEDLEYFDENNELSNKGLIKGLIKLCHMQDKKIKHFDNITSKAKIQAKFEVNQKDKIIKQLNEELISLRSSLKGLLNEEIEIDSKVSNRNSFTSTRMSFKK